MTDDKAQRYKRCVRSAADFRLLCISGQYPFIAYHMQNWLFHNMEPLMLGVEPPDTKPVPMIMGPAAAVQKAMRVGEQLVRWHNRRMKGKSLTPR